MTSGKNETLGIKNFVLGPLSTNCYLIYEKSTHKGMLIDPAAYDTEITNYIRDNDIDMVGVLNTHGHPDHILGNADFDLPVMIHKLDEPDLSRRAQRLLADGDIVRLGDIKLEVIHTPGHTPGGISIKYDNLLFTGDTLFAEGVGRTDLAGGDYDTLMKSIRDKILILPDSVRVFPGHGPETTVGHEKEHNPFL